MEKKYLSTQRKLSDQQWLEDLNFMAGCMKDTHPDLFHDIPEHRFDQEVNRLATAIPRLTDNEVIAGLLKLTALTNDWHTQILSSNLTTRWFPIRIEQLQDGPFIVATSLEYAPYLGARVLRIGKLPILQALARLQEITAHDNLHSQRYFAPMFLSIPSVLNGLHLLDDPGILCLEIQSLAGEYSTIEIEAAAFDSDDDLSWYWHQETAPTRDCVTVTTQAQLLPQYWKNTAKNYWFEIMDEYNTVYLGFNLTSNGADESFADFNTRLWKFIDSRNVERLVVDLRHNIGGDRDILPPLYQEVLQCTRINQEGHLFLLIGPKNVSASSHCAAWFAQNTQAIFVGEPTGARLNQYADPQQFRLPHSQLRLMVSHRYWQNSTVEDTRRWIEPHISAGFKSSDYFGLKDPAMEKIAAYFKEESPDLPVNPQL